MKAVILALIIFARRRSVATTTMTTGILSRGEKLSRQGRALARETTCTYLPLDPEWTYHVASTTPRALQEYASQGVPDEGEPFDSELPSLRVDRDAVAQTAPLFHRHRRRTHVWTRAVSLARARTRQCKRYAIEETARHDATKPSASDTRAHVRHPCVRTHEGEHTPAIITSHTGYKVYKPTPGGWLLGSDGGGGARRGTAGTMVERRRKEMP